MILFALSKLGSAAELTMTYPAPGLAGRDNAVVVSGAVPGNVVWVLESARRGSTPVPGCPGLELGLDRPHPTAPGSRANAGGATVVTFHVPATQAGATRGLQAVQVGSCRISEPLGWTWPNALSESLRLAETRLYGEAPSDRAGARVSSGDIDGDGTPDLIVGAPGVQATGAGAVFVVSRPVQGDFELANADATLRGEVDGDMAGIGVVGVGDVDGDGFGEMLIGASSSDAYGARAGMVYLVHGPVSGEVGLGDAEARLHGESDEDQVGQQVSGAGDVDADGVPDLLIGAPSAYPGGAAYLFRRPLAGDVDLGTADAKFVGEREADLAGSVSDAGDVDADGFADILVGAPRNHQGGTHAGAAYLVRGPPSGLVPLATADAKLIGEDVADHAGEAVSGAGDVNQYGFADLLVGAPERELDVDHAGMVYLVLGPVAGDVRLAEADARLTGSRGEPAGRAVSVAGDLDGDGFDDLAIASVHHQHEGTSVGAVYVVRGPVSGLVDLAASAIHFDGEEEYDHAGISVAAVGDLNLDGYADLLIGAQENDRNGTGAGAAYLVGGRDL